jgi:hypothetical protein
MHPTVHDSPGTYHCPVHKLSDGSKIVRKPPNLTATSAGTIQDFVHQQIILPIKKINESRLSPSPTITDCETKTAKSNPRKQLYPTRVGKRTHKTDDQSLKGILPITATISIFRKHAANN